MRSVLRRLLWILLVLALSLAALLLLGEGMRRQRENLPADALAPSTGRWIQAADSSLFIQQWGPSDGPLLLLVHGTGAWSGTWFELPEVLAAAGWRVVAVDLPPFGFSRSSLATPDYSRAAQAARLLALADALGARDVSLLGHSFGAGPALEAALRGQGRWRRLILVDPALGLGEAGEPPACAAPGFLATALARPLIGRTLVGALVTQPSLSSRWLRLFVHRKEAVTERRVRAYQQPFRRSDFSADLAAWAAVFAASSCESSALSLDPQRLSDWARNDVPVALIWGEQDTITPLAQARALQRWLPQARLTVLPDVGHIPHIEAPAAFAKVLLEAAGAVSR
ncbi:MAG: alpha/beta hydrolase [Burkholderiaceae bacterium]